MLEAEAWSSLNAGGAVDPLHPSQVLLLPQFCVVDISLAPGLPQTDSDTAAFVSCGGVIEISPPRGLRDVRSALQQETSICFEICKEIVSDIHTSKIRIFFDAMNRLRMYGTYTFLWRWKRV